MAGQGNVVKSVLEECVVRTDQLVLDAAAVETRFKDGPELHRALMGIRSQLNERYKDFLNHEQDVTLVHAWQAFREKLFQCSFLVESLRDARYLGKVRFGRRLLELRRELQTLFNAVLMALTMCMADGAADGLAKAAGDVHRLAIATGNPDFEELDEAAAEGITLQGYRYLYGYGTTASPETAFRRFLAAAKFGLPAAANMLAQLYERGLGVPQDLAAALGWYKRAAAHDYPEALYNVGRLYEEGIGVVADYDVAASYYRRGAEANQLDAQAALGWLHESGALRESDHADDDVAVVAGIVADQGGACAQAGG